MRRFWRWLKATLGLETMTARVVTIEGLQSTQGDELVKMRRRVRDIEQRLAGGQTRHHQGRRYDQLERDRSRHVHPDRHH